MYSILMSDSVENVDILNKFMMYDTDYNHNDIYIYCIIASEKNATNLEKFKRYLSSV